MTKSSTTICRLFIGVGFVLTGAACTIHSLDPKDSAVIADQGVDGVDVSLDVVADQWRNDVDVGAADGWDRGAGEPSIDQPLSPDVLAPDLPDLGPTPDVFRGATYPGVTTLAGGPEPGHVDGVGVNVRFDNPVNLTVDERGDIFICDFNNSLIRKANLNGAVVTLTQQKNFRRPFGMVVGADGLLYVQTDVNDRLETGDSVRGTVWWIDRRDGVPHVVVRDVGRPRGLGALADGRLVLADVAHHTIRLLDPVQRSITDLAGEPDVAGWVDAVGQSARFDQPYSVATRGSSIYIADFGNHLVRKVTLQGIVTTVAGNGQPGYADAKGEQAQFNFPKGIDVDSNGVLYVSEEQGHRIRRIATDGSVSTVAGDGTAGFADNPDPLQARLHAIEGLGVFPGDDYLVVADGTGGEILPYHRIRRVFVEGSVSRDLGVDLIADSSRDMPPDGTIGSDGVMSQDGAFIDMARKDAAPKDAAPEDSTPQDSMPQDSTPQDSMPQDSTPQDSTPKDSTPKDSTPKDSTPKDSTGE